MYLIEKTQPILGRLGFKSCEVHIQKLKNLTSLHLGLPKSFFQSLVTYNLIIIILELVRLDVIPNAFNSFRPSELRGIQDTGETGGDLVEDLLTPVRFLIGLFVGRGGGRRLLLVFGFGLGLVFGFGQEASESESRRRKRLWPDRLAKLGCKREKC